MFLKRFPGIFTLGNYPVCFQEIALAIFKVVKLCLTGEFFYGLSCWNPRGAWLKCPLGPSFCLSICPEVFLELAH